MLERIALRTQRRRTPHIQQARNAAVPPPGTHYTPNAGRYIRCARHAATGTYCIRHCGTPHIYAATLQRCCIAPATHRRTHRNAPTPAPALHRRNAPARNARTCAGPHRTPHIAGHRTSATPRSGRTPTPTGRTDPPTWHTHTPHLPLLPLPPSPPHIQGTPHRHGTHRNSTSTQRRRCIHTTTYGVTLPHQLTWVRCGG